MTPLNRYEELSVLIWDLNLANFNQTNIDDFIKGIFTSDFSQFHSNPRPKTRPNLSKGK